MAEACKANPDLARKTLAAILQALASIGQKPVAEALGVSEATVSRMKSDDLERFSALLAVLGRKVVPAENVCYPPEHIKHLEYFAKRGMQAEAPSLTWEDGE